MHGSLEAIAAFVLTSGLVPPPALCQARLPDGFLGRFAHIPWALTAVTIPIDALLAGWLANEFGVVPLSTFGEVWIPGIAGIAWPHAIEECVPAARIDGSALAERREDGFARVRA